MSAAVRLEHPFSNGTEGDAWCAVWCGNCVHDHATHRPNEDWDNGCQWLAASYVGDTPLIWQPMERDWWRTLPAGIACRAFEPCAHDEDAEYREPRPLPVRPTPSEGSK